MRYWWVNHDNTGDREIAGRYLWSPKQSKTNARIQFYENMRRAKPGDAVLSCVNTWIRHAGLVTEAADTAPKPDSYGAENWNKVGWRLPVIWRQLPRAVQPRAHIDEFKQFLPKKYSPIRADGDRNQVYLAEIPEPVFDILLRLGGGDPSELKDQGDHLRASTDSESRVAENQRRYTYTPAVSERELTVNVRIGQGLFRIRIREFERACRLTGITNPRLLVASHIKPWRVSTTAERLDGANGLLLTPHVDRLFDRGLISFEDTGEVKVSSRLMTNDLQLLGLRDACARGSEGFAARQRVYLAYHRRKVFLGE